MDSTGNPLVLATPTQRGPVERQQHAIGRLTSCWQLIFEEKDTSTSAEDILDLVESLEDDLKAIGAPDLPSSATKKKAALLKHADRLKAQDINKNWDAASISDISAGATRVWTAQEVEDEVDRRLCTDVEWEYRPLARDPRSTPKRFMHSIWIRFHAAWEVGGLSEKAGDHYLSLWRALEPFRSGVDPQQSPFAEILCKPKSEDTNSENTNSKDTNSEDTNSEDTNSEDTNSEDTNSEDTNREGTEDNVVWRKVKDIKGGAQGKISLWEMTRQNGQVRSSNALRNRASY